MKRWRCLPGFCGLWVEVVLTNSSPGQVRHDFELIALQGDPSPSVAPDATHGIVGFFPHIDAGGQVALSGFVRTNNESHYALWTSDSGRLSLVAMDGDPTPGRPDEVLDVFRLSSGGDFWSLPNGTVAFRCRTESSRDEGVWHGMAGDLREVAIVGNPCEFLPEADIDRFPSFAFAANGDGVLIRSSVTGGGSSEANDSAIWLSRPGLDPLVVVREGDPVPGIEEGTRYGDLTFATLSINASGEVCFPASLQGGDFRRNAVLVSGPADDPAPVIRKGDPIPGMPGRTWDGIRNARINAEGDLAFEATPNPGGARSFFLLSEGELTKMAAEGEPAPGTDGLPWNGLFFNQIHPAGSFSAFLASFGDNAPNNQSGIWVHEKNEGTRLVAKVGDPAPSLNGLTFHSFNAPAVNALGMVVFQAQTAPGDDGLWLYHGGKLKLLLYEGEFVEVRPGDVRRISSFNLRSGSSSQDGQRSAINDRGQLVIRTSFNTGPLGTAIFRINLADSDGGGVDGILEEAFGGDPEDGTDDLTILPVIEADGGTLLLSYNHGLDGSYTYEVQSSSDGRTWRTASGSTHSADDQSGVPEGFERFEFRPAQLGNNATLMRVKVMGQ